MDDENPPRKIQAARAVACCLWAPIIPLKNTEAAGHGTNTTILHDGLAGDEVLSLADPEDIEGQGE